MNARPLLMIANDAEWCARVCRFLEPHGIGVVTAETVDAAARLAQVDRPRAVLMDAAARANGRAVSQLRQTPLLRDVPVGYMKKSAALDMLLLMLTTSATDAKYHCTV